MHGSWIPRVTAYCSLLLVCHESVLLLFGTAHFMCLNTMLFEVECKVMFSPVPYNNWMLQCYTPLCRMQINQFGNFFHLMLLWHNDMLLWHNATTCCHGTMPRHVAMAQCHDMLLWHNSMLFEALRACYKIVDWLFLLLLLTETIRLYKCQGPVDRLSSGWSNPTTNFCFLTNFLRQKKLSD